MSQIDLVAIVSLFASIAALAVSIYTIWLAHLSEQRMQRLFDNTHSLIGQHFEKVKDVLAEIDKRAMLIDKTVSDSQQSMLQTLTRIIDETVIPKKVDVGEQMAAAFMQSFIDDPTKAGKGLEKMLPLVEMVRQMQQPKSDSESK
jgi:predicted outer membrane protein